MDDCLRAGKLSHYVTSHPNQLSLPSLRETKHAYVIIISKDTILTCARKLAVKPA